MYNRELFRSLEKIKGPLAEVLGCLDPQLARTPERTEKAFEAAQYAMEVLTKLEQDVIAQKI
jgi:hypothetical protein